MIRKKSIMAAALAAVLACQTFPAFGGAAPDGKTLAQDTEAAQGGAYDAWKERWKELSGDWTQVSITPGADETQMNFAWYSRKGEDAGFRYGKQAGPVRRNGRRGKEHRRPGGLSVQQGDAHGAGAGLCLLLPGRRKSGQQAGDKGSGFLQLHFCGRPADWLLQ